MASEGVNMNLNVHLRTDAAPEQLVKELLLSPLIYIRLVGIVSSSALLHKFLVGVIIWRHVTTASFAVSRIVQRPHALWRELCIRPNAQ